jgi:uncharacterized protein YdhG (YjbR/CyaY superfamily)
MAPEIKAYLESLPREQRDMAVALRSAVKNAEPSLQESISSWGYVSFSVPGMKGFTRSMGVITIVPHKEYTNLQFYNGVELLDVVPQLEGTGKRMRHLKFAHSQTLDTGLLVKAVRASVARVKGDSS